MGVLVSYIFNCGSSALLVLSRRVLGVCCIPCVNVQFAELRMKLIETLGVNLTVELHQALLYVLGHKAAGLLGLLKGSLKQPKVLSRRTT